MDNKRNMCARCRERPGVRPHDIMCEGDTEPGQVWYCVPCDEFLKQQRRRAGYVDPDAPPAHLIHAPGSHTQVAE